MTENLPRATISLYGRDMNFVAPPQTRETPAQRAQGKLVLGFKRLGAATKIDTLFQQGALKARLPRPQDATLCEAVTLNISGGVAGGDQLDTMVTLAPGAQVALASQAAERIYRALGPAARIRTRLTVQDGARLDYLPQETILFDRFALDRALGHRPAWRCGIYRRGNAAVRPAGDGRDGPLRGAARPDSAPPRRAAGVSGHDTAGGRYRRTAAASRGGRRARTPSPA